MIGASRRISADALLDDVENKWRYYKLRMVRGRDPASLSQARANIERRLLAEKNPIRRFLFESLLLSVRWHLADKKAKTEILGAYLTLLNRTRGKITVPQRCDTVIEFLRNAKSADLSESLRRSVGDAVLRECEHFIGTDKQYPRFFRPDEHLANYGLGSELRAFIEKNAAELKKKYWCCWHVGAFYEATHMPEAALAWFIEGLNVAAKEHEAHTSYVRNHVVDAAEKVGNLDLAIMVQEKQIEKYVGWGHGKLAGLYVKRGDREKAFAIIEKMLKDKENFLYVAIEGARFYMQHEGPERAIPILGRALPKLREETAQSNACLLLAECLLKTGEYKRAKSLAHSAWLSGRHGLVRERAADIEAQAARKLKEAEDGQKPSVKPVNP